MPPIWCDTAIKGEKGEVKTEALLNSGSDVVVLPEELVPEIQPKPSGTVVVELADGRAIRREAHEIEIEVVDERGETRRTKTQATIEKRDYPLIGALAMEKLGIVLNMKEGKISFV